MHAWESDLSLSKQYTAPCVSDARSRCINVLYRVNNTVCAEIPEKYIKKAANSQIIIDNGSLMMYYSILHNHGWISRLTELV